MNRVSASPEPRPASATSACGAGRISTSRASSSARSSASSSSSSSCSTASASIALSSIAPRSSASSRNSWSGVSKTVFSSLPSLSLSAGSRATALEALDPAAALDPALGAGVGGVAIGAHVDDDLVPRRARDEAPPARGAADSRERELRVVVLQGNRLLREYAARSRNEIRHAAAKYETPRTPFLFPQVEGRTGRFDREIGTSRDRLTGAGAESEVTSSTARGAPAGR